MKLTGFTTHSACANTTHSDMCATRKACQPGIAPSEQRLHIAGLCLQHGGGVRLRCVKLPQLQVRQCAVVLCSREPWVCLQRFAVLPQRLPRLGDTPLITSTATVTNRDPARLSRH